VGVILIVSLPSRGVIVIPPAGDVKLKANLVPPFVSLTCILAVEPVRSTGSPLLSYFSTGAILTVIIKLLACKSKFFVAWA